MVTKTGVFTGTITSVITVQDGSISIDMNNVGAASGRFKGDKAMNGIAPSFVSLAAGNAYSFPPQDKPYGEIVIDGTGTSIEVSISF